MKKDSTAGNCEQNDLVSLISKDGKIKTNDIKELWFARMAVNYPCLAIAPCFLIFLICVFILSSIYGPMFIFPETLDMREFSTPASKATQQRNALADARESLESVTVKIPVKTNEVIGWELQVFWQLSDKNELLLNPENVAMMEDMEAVVYPGGTDADYYSLCLSNVASSSWPDCSEDAIQSLVPSLAGLNQSEIDALVAEWHADSSYYGFFNSEFNETGVVTMIRSFYKLALPYPDISPNTSSFLSKSDLFEDQTKYYTDWIDSLVDEEEWSGLMLSEFSSSSMNTYMWNGYLFIELMFQYLFNDFIWIVLAIALVWITIAVHVHSSFISLFGMAQILMSLPYAVFVYYLVFGIDFYSVNNFFTLFIVLGIGADDMFIFYDCWMQAEVKIEDPSNLIARMSYTYRRAGKAMSITTFTTVTTFLSTMGSPIVGVRAFGLYSAMVILFDFLLSLTVFPVGVVLAWKYPKLRSCPCCTSKKEVKANTEAFRLFERFFGTKYSPCNAKFRYVILAMGVLLMGLSIGGVTQLKILSERDPIFDEGHELNEFINVYANFYSAADDSISPTGWFIWGIEGLDRSKLSYFSLETGDVIWAEDTNVYTADAQEYVIEFCDALEMRTDLFLEDSVACFMRDYKDWREERNETFPAVFSDNIDEQQEEFYADLYLFTTDSPLGSMYRYTSQLGFSFEDNAWHFAAVTCKSKMDIDDPIEKNLGTYDDWVQFIDEESAKAPDGAAINSWANTGEGGFTELDFMNGLRRSIFTGMLASILVAFFAMIIATGNWIISVLAIFMIIGIILCVASFVWLTNGQLGIVESICAVIMIGFSVDYTVHIGIAYLENNHLETSFERTRMALVDMGVPILFGAITTFCGCFPLALCIFKMWSKFGILVMVTIFLALCWSMIVFPAMLVLFGPIGDQGNLALVHYFLDCKCCREKEDQNSGIELQKTVV